MKKVINPLLDKFLEIHSSNTDFISKTTFHPGGTIAKSGGQNQLLLQESQEARYMKQ